MPKLVYRGWIDKGMVTYLVAMENVGIAANADRRYG
jgi:hypothetical protein